MTSRPPRFRRRWIVLAVVLILVAGFVRLLDVRAPVDYYRLIDGRTIAIGTVTGPMTWTRVTDVMETASSVTVAVYSLRAPLPGFGDDIAELTVTLRDPLGDRAVIDAGTGLAVRRN